MTHATPEVLRFVTFEVDRSLLFDMLKTMGGDTSALGDRLVSALMMEPGLSERIGMAVYGVTLVEAARD